MTQTSFKSFPFATSEYNSTEIKVGDSLPSLLNDVPAAGRVALVTTEGARRRGLVAEVRAALSSRLKLVVTDVDPNPDIIRLIDQGRRFSAIGIDLIIGIGGGSALDTTKVLGVFAQDPDFPLNEYVTLNRRYDGERIPVIAVPTTAGTGSEVTPFATVWATQSKKKYSLSGSSVLPTQAWLIPQLSVSVPAHVTIGTGLDAISQALESIWNQNAIEESFYYAVESLRRSLTTLPKLVKNPFDLELRKAMLEASTFAGLAISHTRTAIAHSISYPLTMHFGLPHGLAAGFTLPAILRFNAQEEDGYLNEAIAKLGYRDAEELAGHLEKMMIEIGVPELVKMDLGSGSGVYQYIDEMFTPDRAGNNRRQLNTQDVIGILNASFNALNIRT